MDPNNNQYPNTNNQYPIDYLNQIAPETKKPGPSNRWLVLIAIIGGVVALIVGVLMLLGSSAGPTDAAQRLTARLQTLQSVSEQSQKTIKSSNLRGINSNLNIFLTNTNRDIVTPLSNIDVDAKKLSKNVVAEEKGEKLTASLEDARLNAVYDNTYAREMSFQLATVVALMDEVYAKTNSTSMKKFLEDTIENLEPIKKQLDDFNSTSN